MSNDEVKRLLLEHARELDRTGGALFQVRAFRAAAIAVQALTRPIADIAEEKGRPGIEAIPGVGKSIASAIDAILTTGRLRALRNPNLPPREQVLNVAGVGHRTAERLRERGIDTASELHEAGLADAVPDLSPPEPTADEILAADAAFRAGQSGPWRAGGWLLRARWCASALAFRLGKSGDWVEVIFTREGESGSRLVVTEDGRRAVRGREERRVA